MSVILATNQDILRKYILNKTVGALKKWPTILPVKDCSSYEADSSTK